MKRIFKVLKDWGEPIETEDGRELFLEKGNILSKEKVDEIIREEQIHLHQLEYFQEYFQEISRSEIILKRLIETNNSKLSAYSKNPKQRIFGFSEHDVWTFVTDEEYNYLEKILSEEEE